MINCNSIFTWLYFAKIQKFELYNHCKQCWPKKWTFKPQKLLTSVSYLWNCSMWMFVSRNVHYHETKVYVRKNNHFIINILQKDILEMNKKGWAFSYAEVFMHIFFCIPSILHVSFIHFCSFSEVLKQRYCMIWSSVWLIFCLFLILFYLLYWRFPF